MDDGSGVHHHEGWAVVIKRSTNELAGASSFPLKVETLEDGTAKVTSIALPGKEWVGADGEAATRAARNFIDAEFAKTGLPQNPKWAAEFGAKPLSHDWLKD